MFKTALVLAMTSQPLHVEVSYQPLHCMTGMTIAQCREYKISAQHYRTILTGHLKGSMLLEAENKGGCEVIMKDLSSFDVKVRISCTGDKKIEHSLRQSLRAAFPLPEPDQAILWPETLRIRIVTVQGETQ